MALPLLLALDYGGILYWTQYIASLAVVAAFILAIPSLFGRDNARGIKQHWMLFPMLAWGVYSFLQTVPLPAAVTGILSPASAEAYTSWIEPFIPADQLPSMFPISIDQHASAHATAILWILVALMWTSSVVFSTRSRLTALLSSIAFSGAVVASIGIARRLVPGFELWSFTDTGIPFATFVNRNNAALFLNLGLACGLGLLSWRTSALTGQDVDDPEFEYSDLVSLVSDLQSMIGILAIVLCSAGLALGGSRGGLVAAIAGMLLAFGWVRQRRGFSTVAVVGAAVAIGVGALTIPTDLSLESIQRLEFDTQSNQSTILRDGRLAHWPDGVRTAVAHLPAGSGLGTYGHSHLPHLETTEGGWFEHADNLWLELLAEQGVFGLLLFIATFGMAMYTLSTLAESPDAIDHGIRIAGWFCIGSILVSQLFDFGLILPANYIAVAMLFATVMNRAANHADVVDPVGVRLARRDIQSDIESIFQNDAHDDLFDNAPQPATTKSTRAVFERTRVAVTSCVLPGALALPVLMAVVRMGHDAAEQALVSSANANYDNVKNDAIALETATRSLALVAKQSSCAALKAVTARYEARLARFNEVKAAQPANAQQQTQFFAMTAASIRSNQDSGIRNRPSWLESNRAFRHYAPALEQARQTLLVSPLDRPARWAFAHLDFAHASEYRSLTAVQQLCRLNYSSARQQLTLGRKALASNDPETAKEAFRRAVSLFPRYARNLFADIRDSDRLDFVDIYAADPVAYQLIGDLALAEARNEQTAIPQEQLVRICENQKCEKCKTIKTQIDCLSNQARLLYALGEFDESFDTYEKVITLRPRHTKFRIEYINVLTEQGRLQEAREQCQIGKSMSPKEPYYSKAIEAIVVRELSR